MLCAFVSSRLARSRLLNVDLGFRFFDVDEMLCNHRWNVGGNSY